jgi:imidazolonepropionase
MRFFLKNIKELVGVRERRLKPLCGEELSKLETIKEAYLIADKGTIIDFGEMSELVIDGDSAQLKAIEESADEVVDCSGKMVLPAFCDSHTHLVYAGSREIEFMDKIRGLSYQEIAKRGGGILNSVELLHNTTQCQLFEQAKERAEEIIQFGTGAVEIKSGYGLTLEDEMKMLRVAKEIEESTPLAVKKTFLGAHAVPARYKGNKDGYVDEIVKEMIPAIAKEGLAEYVDIFVEEGFFTVEDAVRIFEQGAKYSLRPKVHANQMSFSGGVQVGVRYNAISVDHLEFTGEAEFKALKEGNTIATLLPGATFFLEMEFAPARKMVEYDLPIAIASNYNPGSCPCGDMKFMMALAYLKMKLLPEEVLNAATLNGAFAMGFGEELGSITIGKRANLIITKKIPSYQFIPYAFSTPFVDRIILSNK